MKIAYYLLSLFLSLGCIDEPGSHEFVVKNETDQDYKRACITSSGSQVFLIDFKKGAEMVFPGYRLGDEVTFTAVAYDGQKREYRFFGQSALLHLAMRHYGM